MLRYRGVVQEVNEGWAQVIIRPDACNLVCAPDELQRKLCHCATESSSVVVKVRDPIGVRPGDEVMIHQIPQIGISTMAKFLLPSLAGGLGFLTHEKLAGYLILGFGVLLGIGWFLWDLLHRRVEPPLIDEVISDKKGRDGDEPEPFH
jgi:hypothetical protein